ncbi:MAG: S8 family serine peptidase [Pseudomonadota bacterium]
MLLPPPSRRYRKSIGETFHLLRGLDWAAGNGAKVVNLSFAGPRDPLMERALRAAEEQGIVAVAAAGNRGPRAKPAYPAAYDDVIAVTATDQRDRLYRRSNRGDYIHIAAPGVNIFSASGKKGYRFRSGTSMATAYVSGAAAILLQRKPDLTPADIATRLAATAQDLGVEGRDRQFGHGLLNVLKAAGDD